MSSEKNGDNSAAKNLLTLDQLSQTIEVMTGVVDRLKRHLNMKLLQNPRFQSSELEQRVELDRESLHNERELQELRLLADQQRSAVMGEAGFSVQTLRDDQVIDVKRESFVVEISRLDDVPDTAPNRVLH